MKGSRAATCKMSGNSMHTNVAGAILMFTLTQIGIDKALAKLLLRRLVKRTHPVLPRADEQPHKLAKRTIGNV